MQVLKDKIVWLEATNEELSRELDEYRDRGGVVKQPEAEAKVFSPQMIK